MTTESSAEFLYLGGLITEDDHCNRNLNQEIKISSAPTKAISREPAY